MCASSQPRIAWLPFARPCARRTCGIVASPPRGCRPLPPSDVPVEKIRRRAPSLCPTVRSQLPLSCVCPQLSYTAMMSKTVVALALLEEVAAFQAPVVRSRPVQMFSEGDVGVLPPLGVYDPLGLIETRDMRRSKSCSARIVNSRMNSSLMFHQMHRSHLAARACDDAIICCTCASLVRNACRGTKSWRSSTAARRCSDSST